jgi:hypothetical protein
MTVSQHRANSNQMTQNQKNQMSDDPADGARGPRGSGGGKEPNQIPGDQEQDQSTIEAFGEEGAGIAAKE